MELAKPMREKKSTMVTPGMPDTSLGRSFDVHVQVLPNGLTVLLVENPVIPAIAINATVLAGARHEPEDKAGLAIMASNLLDEGTKTRTSLEIAEAIESTGGHLETDASFERIVVAATVLKQDADLGLDLIADLLANPVFPEEYVMKDKSRTLAEIASAKDRPQVVAGWEFNELIYGTHPLHRPVQGYPDTIHRITRQDLLRFRSDFFVPNNTILSIVGDFKITEILPVVERYFGAWATGVVALTSIPKPVRQAEKREKFVPMPVQQANIYLGHLGIERTNPDFYALQVLDTILGSGAGFTARIPQRLRDELGLAYTTYASITSTAGLDPGRFVAYIGTSPENTKQAVDGLLNEIRRIIAEPVTAGELQDAKDFLTGSFVFAFESSAQIARFLVQAKVYGLGFDYGETYPRLIRAVTTEDIARVAAKYLDTENYTLVVAGPAAAGNLDGQPKIHLS
jgi:zinc protease